MRKTVGMTTQRNWNKNFSHSDILLVGIENCEMHNADRKTTVHCTARILNMFKSCRLGLALAHSYS